MMEKYDEYVMVPANETDADNATEVEVEATTNLSEANETNGTNGTNKTKMVSVKVEKDRKRISYGARGQIRTGFEPSCGGTSNESYEPCDSRGSTCTY